MMEICFVLLLYFLVTHPQAGDGMTHIPVRGADYAAWRKIRLEPDPLDEEDQLTIHRREVMRRVIRGCGEEIFNLEKRNRFETALQKGKEYWSALLKMDPLYPVAADFEWIVILWLIGAFAELFIAGFLILASTMKIEGDKSALTFVLYAQWCAPIAHVIKAIWFFRGTTFCVFDYSFRIYIAFLKLRRIIVFYELVRIGCLLIRMFFIFRNIRHLSDIEDFKMNQRKKRYESVSYGQHTADVELKMNTKFTPETQKQLGDEVAATSKLKPSQSTQNIWLPSRPDATIKQQESSSMATATNNSSRMNLNTETLLDDEFEDTKGEKDKNRSNRKVVPYSVPDRFESVMELRHNSAKDRKPSN